MSSDGFAKGAFVLRRDHFALIQAEVARRQRVGADGADASAVIRDALDAWADRRAEGERGLYVRPDTLTKIKAALQWDGDEVAEDMSGADVTATKGGR